MQDEKTPDGQTPQESEHQEKVHREEENHESKIKKLAFHLIQGGGNSLNRGSPDDTTLLHAARRYARDEGDEDEFTIIYESHYDRLIKYFKARTPGDSICQDLTQQTFLRLWKSRASIHSPERISGFIGKIAQNVLFDHYRRSKSKEETSDEAVIALLEDHEEGPHGRFLAQELEERVRKALRELPPRTALVAKLRILDDLKNKEIAEMLNLKSNNVGVLLNDARKRLRKILGVKKI